jgi:hypothetical protein
VRGMLRKLLHVELLSSFEKYYCGDEIKASETAVRTVCVGEKENAYRFEIL